MDEVPVPPLSVLPGAGFARLRVDTGPEILDAASTRVAAALP